MWASSFRMVKCGNLMRMPTEAAHGQVSSTPRYFSGSEPVNSMKTVKTAFSVKKYSSVLSHFFEENLKRKRTILRSSRSIAVLIRLFKCTQESASTDSHPENHGRAMAAARGLRRGEPTVGTGCKSSHDRGDGQDVGGIQACGPLWYHSCYTHKKAVLDRPAV